MNLWRKRYLHTQSRKPSLRMTCQFLAGHIAEYLSMVNGLRQKATGIWLEEQRLLWDLLLPLQVLIHRPNSHLVIRRQWHLRGHLTTFLSLCPPHHSNLRPSSSELQHQLHLIQEILPRVMVYQGRSFWYTPHVPCIVPFFPCRALLKKDSFQLKIIKVSDIPIFVFFLHLIKCMKTSRAAM